MSRSHVGATVIPAILALVIALPLPAQVIQGRILDDVTEAPVAGALVFLSQGEVPKAHAVSDAEGAFLLDAGAPGVYALRAVRLGYSEAVVPALELGGAGAVLEFDLLLNPKPIALEGLTVSASRYRSDIEELGLRIADLGDRILTREHLAQMGFRDIGAALERRGVPGISVMRGENISEMLGSTIIADRMPFCVRMARAKSFDGTQRCALVVLDQAFATQEAVDALSPEDLEAVVVLTPTEAVQRFGTLGGPGAVLLYTRRGR